MALYQTNIVVILAMPFLFVIITFITVLLEQCSACHIHLIHYGCDLLIKYTFLSECIPTSCFKA